MASLLFADDEWEIRQELEKAAEHLRRRGHSVRVVADGEAAVAAMTRAARHPCNRCDDAAWIEDFTP